jgi:hypothetical protein
MTGSFKTSRNGGFLVALALLLSFALQVQLARVPDTMGDAIELGRWSQRVNALGLNGAYFGRRVMADDYINYPPLSPQIFALLERARTHFPVVMTDPDRENIDFFIKLPAVLAVLGTSLFLFFCVRRQADFKTAYLVMLAYAFNPAVFFIGPYWGQLEPLFALLILLALRCLRSYSSVAWCLVTLAVLTKAHAAPFAPIVALITLRDHGWSGVARGVVACLLTLGAVLSPFIIEGNGVLIVQRMLADLSSSPLASQNGHNFWWIMSEGRWVHAPGYRLAGFAVFGAVYAAALLAIWTHRRGNGDDPESEDATWIYLICALLICAFFQFMTGMHENHLFAVLPFLAMTIHLDRRLAAIYACFTLTVLLNMALHDPYLEAEYLRGGGYLPEQIHSYNLSHLPNGQWVATLANSFANLALGIALAYVTFSRWRGGSMLTWRRASTL